MADFDPNIIPILDDIISTGDTDKAANRPKDDLQKSLELDKPEETETVSEDAEDNFDIQGGESEPGETDIDATEIDATETHNQYADHESSDSDITPMSAETEETPTDDGNLDNQEFTSDAADFSAEINDESPSNEPVEEQPIAIETLTEDILTSIMPEMEHLLRERIRQILEQQLQNND